MQEAEKEMRREAKGKRVKQTLDVLIILCGAGAVFLVFKEIGTWRFAPAVYFVIVIGMAAAIYDLSGSAAARIRKRSCQRRKEYRGYKG